MRIWYETAIAVASFGGLWLVTMYDHCHSSRASTSLATSPVFCLTLPHCAVNLTASLSLVGHSGSWLSRGRFSLSFYTYVWYAAFDLQFLSSYHAVADTSRRLGLTFLSPPPSHRCISSSSTTTSLYAVSLFSILFTTYLSEILASVPPTTCNPHFFYLISLAWTALILFSYSFTSRLVVISFFSHHQCLQ